MTTCEVVGFEETRDVVATMDEDGVFTGLEPVDGSHQAFLTLVLPGGAKMLAKLDSPAYLDQVISLMASEAVV